MSQPLSAATLQESVRTQVTERRGVLARAGPAAMMALLGAAALWPVVAPVLGTGVAVGVAGGALGLLSGPGSGAVSAFLDRTLDRLRGRDEPAARDELERELLARLTAGDPAAAALRAEVSRLLEEGGAVDAALSAVPAESRDELATRLAELGAEWHEFRWMLGAVQDQLQELQARQIEALALHRTTLDLQREQLVKTNLLLRRQEPAPAPPPEEGNGAPAVPPAPVASPYKGLEPFQPEDAERFFGRDGLVAALLARLAEAPFLAVIGPSGSGKSSAVRAGLVPGLWAGRLPGSDGWKTVIMTPGERPLEQLAHRLALERGVAPGSVLDDLRSRPDGLRLIVEQALLDEPDGVRLVLVVDQFEELFTLSRDADERAAFVAALAAAGERAVVIVALRADFYGHAAGLGPFADLLGNHQELVGPMSREELVEAIERPAEGAGLTLEPGLAETIVDDVADEPGALPLLSHALLSTFERRQGTLLTHQGYVESGGVRGAIARTADSVFEQRLDPGQQALARGILLRLTQLGEGTEDTRRRVRPDTLVAAGEPAEPVEAVLRTLVDARLVTAGEGTVEVAHEALIREWPRLRGWLAENREGLEIHHRLAENASDWEALNREPAALMRGSRLLAAKEWAERYPGDMNALEREFLDASRAAERSELEAARRRTRRLWALSAALGVLAMAAVGAAVFAVNTSRDAGRQRDAAEREATIALSGNLAAQSATELDRRLDVAMLTALEAYRLDRSPQARDALLRSIKRSAPLVKQLHGHTLDIGSLSFSADGKRLASASRDGSVRLWDVEGGRQLGEPIVKGMRESPLVLLTPDGDRVAVAGNGTITLWNTESREQLGSWNVESSFLADGASSADGATLAFTSYGSWLYVLDVARGRLQQRSEPGDVGDHHVALSPDGEILAWARQHRPVTLWDIRRDGPHLKRRFEAQGQTAIASLTFGEDGRSLIAGVQGGTVRRWNVVTGRPLSPLKGTGTGFGTIVDPDSGTVVTEGDAGDTVQIRHGARRTWPADPGGNALALTSGGERLAVGKPDGTVEIWDATADLPFAKRLPNLRADALAVDGDVIAASRTDGSIGVWSARTGQPAGRDIAPAGRERVWYLGLSGDEAIAVYGDDAGRLTARIWPRSRPATSVPAIAMPRFRLGDEVAVLSPDGSALAWTQRDRLLRIWSIRDDVVHESKLDSELIPEAGFRSPGFRFAPDSRTLIVWGGKTVELVPVGREGERERLAAPGEVLDAALSHDGETLATDIEGVGLRLWNRRSRDRFGGDFSGAYTSGQLAFSPDGRLLLSVGMDRMTMWDLRTRRVIGDAVAVAPSNEEVHDFAFVGDPPRLVTGGYSGPFSSVYVFDPILSSTSFRSFEERVCGIVNRNLQRSEVAGYPTERKPGRCVR